MKKIVFVLPHMLCGGVEKALLSLINEMPEDKYQISIILAEMEGDFLNQIPANISVDKIRAPKDSYVIEGTKAALLSYLKRGKLIKFARVCINIITKADITTLTTKFENIPAVQEKYDVAVCFHIHMPLLLKYVLYKIDAKNKVAWIHNDFKSAKFDVCKYGKLLEQYNHIFCVSNQLKEELLECLPKLNNKVSVAPNIISKQYINTMLKYAGNENCFDTNDKIKLLTIGRLESQKGYDLAIEVCKLLKNDKLNFRWYVLGDGSLRKELETRIEKNGLNEYFYLLGVRTNPYPYIRDCDIYVQPSIHEGYGIAVAEARVLNKPILCTDFTGARDQIIPDVTGMIVDTNVLSIYKGLKTLICSEGKRKTLSENLSKTNPDTSKAVQEILSFL